MTSVLAEHPTRTTRHSRPERPVYTAPRADTSPSFSPVHLEQDQSHESLRQAYGHFPVGVAALAGLAGGQPEVLVASSFTVGVSWEPPLVSFAVQDSSRTWPRLRQAERLGVSILAEGQQSLTRQLASRSGDRLAGLELQQTEHGALLLPGAALWLETSVHAEVPAGDHHVVLLRVHAVADHSGRHEPVVLHRSAFRSLRTAEES